MFFFENGRFDNFPRSLSWKPCHSQPPPPHWRSRTPMCLGEPLRLLRTRAMEELPRNAVLPSEVKGWEWWLGGVNRCEHCKPPWLLSGILYKHRCFGGPFLVVRIYSMCAELFKTSLWRSIPRFLLEWVCFFVGALFNFLALIEVGEWWSTQIFWQVVVSNIVFSLYFGHDPIWRA